jgi:hypothetical protein
VASAAEDDAAGVTAAEEEATGAATEEGCEAGDELLSPLDPEPLDDPLDPAVAAGALEIPAVAVLFAVLAATLVAGAPPIKVALLADPPEADPG